MTRPSQAGLNAAQAGMVRRGGPIPLIGLLGAVAGWIERRHMELLAEAGFDDVRTSHNAVFVNMPAEGIRLTDLAHTAGVSKQAMAEMVDELVAKGYLRRAPDPADGRAKLILMAPRGQESHVATLAAFQRIEDELGGVVGPDAVESVRAILTTILQRVLLGDDRDPGGRAGV